MEKNIRKMTITTSSGEDVKSTKQLSGEASQTAAWKAKNETVQHMTSKAQMGTLGGKASND